MQIVIGTSRPFHLFHLARELADLGHDVRIIGYMPSAKAKAYDCGNAKYVSFFWLLFPIAILALQRRFISLQQWATFVIMPIIDLCISFSMKNCDFFIGLSGVNVKSFAVAKRKFGAITICDRGSAHVLKQLELLNNRGIPRKYLRRELKGYELVDFIMVPSLFAYNSFLEKGMIKEKVLINNYGVNLERFKPIRKFDKNKSGKRLETNALFIGGWSYQKGVDLISKVLQEDSCLIVSHIGNDGGAEYPLARFNRVGHLPNEKLRDELCKFDVLLLPSRQDGFGMVLLEALASGVPVIASKNTGGPDIKLNIEHGESVMIMDDVSDVSLKQALIEFRRQTLPLGDLLTQKDRSYFSWAAYGRRYNNILEKLRK